MGVLSDVLNYKAQREAQESADIAAIPQAINNFLSARQQAQDNLFKELTLKATLAKAGLRIDATGRGLERDESLVSETDKFLKMGKLAGAAKSIFDAGGPDLIGQVLPSNTQFSNFFPANSGQQNQTPQGSNINTAQPKTIQPSVNSSESNSGTGGYSLMPSKVDRQGRVTEFKFNKPSESSEKRGRETEELASGVNSLVSLFRSAQDQRDQFLSSPSGGVLPKGTEQIISGKVSSLAAAFGGDNLDAVDSFNRRKKAFATTVAKAAGEQRPTDEDIQRFIESLPNVDSPDATNERLIQGLVDDLNARGAKAVWAERIGTNEKSNSQESKKTDFSSIEDAEKANLPSGTIVTIGGKRARIK